MIHIVAQRPEYHRSRGLDPHPPRGSGCLDPQPPRRSGGIALTIIAATLAASIAAGCAPKTPPRPAKSTPPTELSNTDPCAMRLHDICGGLLLYYAMRHELPEHLSDLPTLPTTQPGETVLPELTCPVSGLPYIYDPVGLRVTDPSVRYIVYDPTPAHAGMRWAIAAYEPQTPGDPLIMKVLARPDGAFPQISR